MRYEKRKAGNGEWSCPFEPEWVEMMATAAKRCEKMSAEYIEAAIRGEVMSYTLPPGDFLSELQDARGLPLSWCKKDEQRHKSWLRCCASIYDYDTVPDIVVTNGEDDWPYNKRSKVLQA